MNEYLKYFIKTQFFLNYSINIDNNIGEIICPKIKDLKNNFMIFLYLCNKFIDLYINDKVQFYLLLMNDKNYNDFITLISLVTNCEKISFKQGKFSYNNFNFIDESNIDLFIEIIKVMIHRDFEKDYYKPANKIAEKMMERAKKLKEELRKKQKNKKNNNLGLLEILSTVSGRHNSINVLNIENLNYFQLLNQYKKLINIDNYNVKMNAYSNGNLKEEGIKKLKHYSYENQD